VIDVASLIVGGVAGVLAELASRRLKGWHGKVPIGWILPLVAILALWIWSPRYGGVPVAVASYAVAVAAMNVSKGARRSQ
jgi:uncharacterized membrane protein YeaQ/YmgE (transglycosylase-associated protein family)